MKIASAAAREIKQIKPCMKVYIAVISAPDICIGFLIPRALKATYAHPFAFSSESKKEGERLSLGLYLEAHSCQCNIYEAARA